jgi:hypothetical protein
LSTMDVKLCVIWSSHGEQYVMMEAVRSSETLVNIYQTTRGSIPEDSHLRCVTKLTMLCRIFIDRMIFAPLEKKFPIFMEPECSQKPGNGPYLEPAECNPHSNILLANNIFISKLIIQDLSRQADCYSGDPEISHFHGTLRFITLCIKSRHWTVI